MNRRQFAGALAVSAFAQPAAPRVNAGRLRRRLEELSVFGRPPVEASPTASAASPIPMPMSPAALTW
jgi:hypothetical protein